MISVIVPVYNTEKYLKKCIESILNQSYREIELLLIDDGSTDNSPAVCQNYAEKDVRVKYIRVENGGQGKARNLALDICRGEYIAFVDSDDFIEAETYEKMLRFMRVNDADMAVCGLIRNHGFQKRKQPCPSMGTVYKNAELIKSYLSEPYITSCLWNKLYRRGLWDGIRFPEYRAREDIAVLYLVYARVRKAVHIGTCEYVQYVREGSTERSEFNKNKLCALKIAEQIKRFVQENYPELSPLAALEPAKVCVGLMEEIAMSDYERNKEVYNGLYARLRTELLNIAENNERSKEEYDFLCGVRDNQKTFFKNCKKRRRKNFLVNRLQKIYECLHSRS